MPRYIPHRYYGSCPSRRGGYGGRGRSPPRGYGTPRRGYRPPKRGGYGGGGGTREEQDHGCLLVRNIPLDCRPEELRVPFERFGAVRDVYIPKDYYTGEPRGFAFVKFVDPYEAADARYRMNGQVFAGLEMGVAAAVGSKKRPDEMCRRETRISCGGGNPRYGGRRPYNCRRYRSRSVVSRRSRSPLPRCRGGGPRGPGHRSRSYSPSPWRRAADFSVSLTRPVWASRFPRKRGVRRRSLSPTCVELAGRRKGIGNGYDRECDAVDRGRGEGSGHHVVVLDSNLLTWKQKQMEGCKMRIEAAINGRRKVTTFGRGVLN